MVPLIYAAMVVIFTLKTVANVFVQIHLRVIFVIQFCQDLVSKKNFPKAQIIYLLYLYQLINVEANIN